MIYFHPEQLFIITFVNLRRLEVSWSTQEVLEKKKLAEACPMVIQIRNMPKAHEKQEPFAK